MITSRTSTTTLFISFVINKNVSQPKACSQKIGMNNSELNTYRKYKYLKKSAM